MHRFECSVDVAGRIETFEVWGHNEGEADVNAYHLAKRKHPKESCEVIHHLTKVIVRGQLLLPGVGDAA